VEQEEVAEQVGPLEQEGLAEAEVNHLLQAAAAAAMVGLVPVELLRQSCALQTPLQLLRLHPCRKVGY
jgi:hypothetical protein